MLGGSGSEWVKMVEMRVGAVGVGAGVGVQLDGSPLSQFGVRFVICETEGQTEL